MLKAVTLDYWNTLFIDQDNAERERRRVQRLREELAAIGKPRREEAVRDALAAGFDQFDRVWLHEQRTPGAAEGLEVIFSELNVKPPDDVFARVVDFFENLLLDVPPTPVPGVAEVLPYLAARYKLAIVSDTGYTPAATLRELLDRHGLLQYFSATYFSSEGGMSKPDKRVFLRVLNELDVHPSEAAHVGDMQRTDIAGAHAAGMLAVHFVGVNKYDAAISTGDALIYRFDELPTALGNFMCPGC
jgi:putative hydrolase of the HAD superfamily